MTIDPVAKRDRRVARSRMIKRVLTPALLIVVLGMCAGSYLAGGLNGTLALIVIAVSFFTCLMIVISGSHQITDMAEKMRTTANTQEFSLDQLRIELRNMTFEVAAMNISGGWNQTEKSKILDSLHAAGAAHYRSADELRAEMKLLARQLEDPWWNWVLADP